MAKQRQGREYSPVAFWEEVVAPALFENLDQAFPEFGWRRSPRGWVATVRVPLLARLGLGGEVDGGPRPDRVVCERPFGLLVHGSGALSWTTYVAGGGAPRGFEFVEAVRELARRAGVDPSPLERELSPEEAEKAAERARRADLLELFVAQAQAALQDPAAEGARAYLESRGFKTEELERTGLGYYSNPAEVAKQLQAAGYTAAEVEASGVVADGRWAGRLLIPWRDRWGHVATVAARAVADGAEHKYLYLTGASKPPFFGLDVAARAVRPKGLEVAPALVIVEGLIDVVALQLRGFEHVVALGGAGSLLNARRWKDLAAAGVKRAVLVLDNDGSAGPEGTRKALGELERAEVELEAWAVVPGLLGRYKDPDALVRAEGFEAFQSVLDQAERAALYRVREALGEVAPESPGPERRAAAERAVAAVVGLGGPRAALDAEEAFALVERRTGYTFEALEATWQAVQAQQREAQGRTAIYRLLTEAQGFLDGGTAPAEVLEQVATKTAQLQAITGAQQEPEPPRWDVDRLLAGCKQTPAGKRAGWEALDQLGVVFGPGDLALVAGRTGHGKTAFTANLLRGWLQDPAADPEELLVFYSLEEPEERIFLRLLALETAHGEEGRWTLAEAQAELRGEDPPPYGFPPLRTLDAAVDQLRGWEGRLQVVYRPGWTVERIAAHARGLAAEQPVGAIFVDYLQRLPVDGKADRRDLELSAIGRGLKDLAVAVQAPVVAGAQLGRETAQGKEVPTGDYSSARAAIRKRRPEVHNVREGGSEQEADLILGLLNYRADWQAAAKADGREVQEPQGATLLEVGALKNRYGQSGRWAALAWEGRFGLVRDPDPGGKEDL